MRWSCSCRRASPLGCVPDPNTPTETRDAARPTHADIELHRQRGHPLPALLVDLLHPPQPRRLPDDLQDVPDPLPLPLPSTRTARRRRPWLTALTHSMTWSIWGVAGGHALDAAPSSRTSIRPR